MKHYGAVLTGDSNIVDGNDSSVLTIGTATANDDKIIIYNAAPGTVADGKDTDDIGLVIVPYGTFSWSQVGTTGRYIPTHGLAADGGEYLLSDIQLAVNENLSIPISNGTSFVDSVITQDVITQTDTEAVVVTIGNSANDSVVITGNLTVNGTTTTVNSTTLDVADVYITAATTNLNADKPATAGGMFVEYLIENTNTTQEVTYAGIRVGADGIWEVTSNATTPDGSTGDWDDLGLSTGGVSSIRGAAGIAVHTAATPLQDGLTPSTQSPVLRVALTPLSITDPGTTAGGGLTFDGTADGSQTIGIDDGGITAGQLASRVSAASSLGAANNRGGLGDGTAGQVLASSGDGGFTWTSALQKYADDHTVASGAITIARSTHGIADNDLTITVYEYINASNGNQITGGATTATANLNMIIPESITITPAGAVTITVGTAQNSNELRVVIKG